MRNSKKDFTHQRWFARKINQVHTGNLLLDIVPNFGFLRTFGRNTLDRTMKYLGHNEYLDEFTGYVLGWDRKHKCDRCGASLDYKGSKSVRMAYAMATMPHLRHCGLCEKCDRELEREKTSDNDLYKQMPRGFGKSNKHIRDYRDVYIWL